jgi:hypothetical protein
VTEMLVPILLVGALVLWIALSAFRRAVAGRGLAAWGWPGGVALAAVGMVTVFTVLDTHGQAGLAAVFILGFFFLPLFAGGVLGCIVGHVVAALRRGGSGGASI